MKFLTITKVVTIASVCFGLLLGCSNYGGNYRSSSVVDLVYGKEQGPLTTTDTISLQVPLSVGIAFVPSANGHSFPSEMELLAAADEVRQHFANEKGVKRIQVIPSYHLRGRQGFDRLAELGRLYQVDVMALISYDQVVNESTNSKSFWYLTVVGAYLVNGNEASVQTFMETTVFDLHSRHMLFSAPGYDKRTRSSNMSNTERDTRSSQSASFHAAVTQMTGNLAVSLEQFKKDIREDGRVDIKPRVRPTKPAEAAAGSSPVTLGGALPEFVILGALCLVLLRFGLRKSQRLLSAVKMKSK